MNNKKHSKLPIIIGIIVGIVILLDIFLFACWLLGDDDTDPVVPDIPVNVVDNVKVEDDKTVVYEDVNFKINITVITEEEKSQFMADESNGELVQGVTNDGKEFEGRGDTIFVKSDEKVVAGKVEKKKNVDISKAAGVTTTVTATTGYKKGANDWNTGYKTYYIEKANCVLYYPAQLKVKSESKDKITFTDSRSKATLTVTLSKNTYSCMDEVEDFLYSDKEGDVLASGTDWYTTLLTEKKAGTEMFDYIGLGNDYIVSCSLKYETKYDFVFIDLRSLIKCKFVDEGKWVSNARTNTVGKTAKVLQSDPGVYDPAILQTSYLFEDWRCVVYYPDIFTKAYEGDDGTRYFTDPHTGAYIEVTRKKTDMTTQKQLQDSMDVFETELVGSKACKGKTNSGKQRMLTYRAIMDGYIYGMDILYPEEYDYVYGQAYKFISVALDGEGISNTEMKDIYFKEFSCNVTIPMQFKETERDGETIIYEDVLTGMLLRLNFSEMKDPEEYLDLYSVFNVVATDKDIIYGEYYVKWHNKNGAFIGSVGAEYACLMELSYSNAYSVYEDSWKRFAINFSDAGSFHTPADEIRDQVDELLEKQMTEGSDEGDGGVTGQNNNSDPGDGGKYDSGYEMVAKAPELHYEDLPFSKSDGIKVEIGSYGVFTLVCYEFTTENWVDEIIDIYNALLEDFYQDYYELTEYSCDAYLIARADSEFAGMKIFFSASEYALDVVIYNPKADTTPQKGKMGYSKEIIDDFCDCDNYAEFAEFASELDGAIKAMYDWRTEEYIMNSYCQFEYREFDDDYFKNETDWTKLEQLPDSFEHVPFFTIGNYKNGKYVAEDVYFANAVEIFHVTKKGFEYAR